MSLFRHNRSTSRGVAMTEYVLIVCLLSATVWAVFATWKIWGWGEQFDFPEQTGQGQDQIAKNLGIDDEINEARNPTTTVATTATTTVAAPPRLEITNGQINTNNFDANTRIQVTFVTSSAALNSQYWVNHNGSSVQLLTTNHGAQNAVIWDQQVAAGDQIEFFSRTELSAWGYSDFNVMTSNSAMVLQTRISDTKIKIAYEDLPAWWPPDYDFNDIEVYVEVIQT